MKMKWKKISIPATLLASAVVLLSYAAETVKDPAVAGAFYPADKVELGRTVDAYLSRADAQPVSGRLIALVSPHAGYQFSGQIAAYAYSHIAERDIETIILIGPSHHAAFSGAAVYAEGSMATPLGKVRINEKLARSLLNEKSGVTFYRDAFAKEHSLEVQLPFLQQSVKKFRIVPILIGSPTNESLAHLSRRLTNILRKDDKTIIIASTDLSHYHDYGTAVGKDKLIIDAMSRMAIEDAERLLRTGEGEMCGGYPVLLTMMVARNLGATNGVLYRYANSGDVTGDKGRVVGYAALGLYQSPLTDDERKELLSLAKRTITQYVKQKKTTEFRTDDSRLLANGAAFVTINRNGGLRGCIGNIQPVMPLYQSVVQNAISAASQDHRFTPMIAEELADMEVEVTVLSPLEPLLDIKDIRIGTHGLFLVNGGNSGILLPQVAAQYGWNVNTFLEQVSVKAGLPKDAWKDSQLYFFSADIVK